MKNLVVNGITFRRTAAEKNLATVIRPERYGAIAADKDTYGVFFAPSDRILADSPADSYCVAIVMKRVAKPTDEDVRRGFVTPGRIWHEFYTKTYPAEKLNKALHQFRKVCRTTELPVLA